MAGIERSHNTLPELPCQTIAFCTRRTIVRRKGKNGYVEFCDQSPPQFVVAECSNIHKSTLEPNCGREAAKFPSERGYTVGRRTKVGFAERNVHYSVISFHIFLRPADQRHVIDSLLQISFKTTILLSKGQYIKDV